MDYMVNILEKIIARKKHMYICGHALILAEYFKNTE